MTTQARIGHEATLKIQDNSSPPVLTSVGEVTNLTPPGMSRDAIDATHSESPNRYREFIKGLKDGGEASADINFVPGSAGFLLLVTKFNDDTDELVVGEIEFPDGSKFNFSAIITNISPAAPVDDKMTASITFKVSGQPVLTQA